MNVSTDWQAAFRIRRLRFCYFTPESIRRLLSIIDVFKSALIAAVTALLLQQRSSYCN